MPWRFCMNMERLWVKIKRRCHLCVMSLTIRWIKFMKGIRSHIPECRRRMGCIITMSKSEQMTFGLSLVNIWLTRTIWLSVLVMIGVIWSWPAIL